MTRLPYFDRPTYGAGNPDRYVRPLPPVLAEAAADTDAGRRHAGIAERWGACRTKIAALAESLQRAQREDTAGERAAAEAGKRRPKPKAPAIADDLDDARRELDVLAGLLAEAADDLLAAAVPHLGAAVRDADGAREAALDEVGDLLAAAASALQRADAAASDGAWLGRLASEGHVYPYGTGGYGRATVNTAQEVRRAAEALTWERSKAAEDAARREREQAAAAERPAPPGTDVWQVPGIAAQYADEDTDAGAAAQAAGPADGGTDA
jgi:hypothetical protein